MQSYRQDGYYIARKVLEPKILQNIKQEAVWIFRQLCDRHGISGSCFEDDLITLFGTSPEAVKQAGKQVQNLPSLCQLMVSESVLQAVRSAGVVTPVINTKPVLFFHNQHLAEQETYYRTPPHQDYATTQGSINSVVIWIPLCHIFPDLGPLEVVPGSHLKGSQWVETSFGFGRVDGFGDEDFVALEASLGDMVIFSTFLVHRSGNNITDRQIRWTASFRFSDLSDPYWQSCDYFSPYTYKSEMAGNYYPDAAKVQKWFHGP